MITVYYFYKGKQESKEFSDPRKALRFMYATKSKFKNFEWVTDDPEDNEYLYTRFY